MKNCFYTLGKILIMSVALFAVATCNTDDDINAIFRGQTWYLTYIQNGDARITLDNKQPYSIDFKNDNFTVTTPLGATINGKWQAKGDKSHSFTCKSITTSGNVSGDSIAEKMYRIIGNAKSYSGDTNWLHIIQDKNTYMQFYN